MIVCSEGYTSSLAAASLQQLGLHKATDLVVDTRRSRPPACSVRSAECVIAPASWRRFRLIEVFAVRFINRGRLIKAHSGSGGTSSGSFRDDG